MRYLLLAAMALTSCGYHLVGHGDGAGVIPADVQALNIISSGEGEFLLPELREELATDALAVSANAKEATQGAHQARLIVLVNPASYTPSAYDVSGIATQYRMVYSGSMTLVREGAAVWQSGLFSEQGEVYVTGDPTSIEASRQQLLTGLRKQWLRTAISRLRSGF